ncbi:MAG TPA: DUF6457 domain-containing protein [Actinomycetota bacterium]|nr:DUF6457 domain-containing protein [Actinomycetota bacterium]
MDEWIDSYRHELAGDKWGDVDPERVLELARVVAHGTERRNAPLATFMAGRYVASQEARGRDAGEGLEQAIALADRLLAGGEAS